MNTTLPTPPRSTGFDPEVPISKYYIESFLRENAEKIHSNILKFGEKEYTEILNGLPTGQGIPEAAYDCFIFNQTLPAAQDIKNVLRNCVALLKPGGHLLFSTGGIYPRCAFNYESWGAYWTTTSTVLNELFAEFVPRENININTYGNIHSAACYLYGHTALNVPKADLDYVDKDYVFLLTAAVKKA